MGNTHIMTVSTVLSFKGAAQQGSAPCPGAGINIGPRGPKLG